MPLGGGPGPRRGRLPFGSKGPVILLAAAGAIVVIVVAAILLSSHGKTAANAGSSTSASGTPTGTSSASATAKTQHQAATSLSALLSQSGGDRADVSAAYTDVSTCGKNLAKDAAMFNKAAANRRTLLGKLAKLPGRSALSTEMLTDLTNAWQASATVDADLAKWATDEAGHCNKKQVLKDKNYIAATSAPQQRGDQQQERVRRTVEPAREEERPAEDPADAALGTAGAPGELPGGGAVALACGWRWVRLPRARRGGLGVGAWPGPGCGRPVAARGGGRRRAVRRACR